MRKFLVLLMTVCIFSQVATAAHATIYGVAAYDSYCGYQANGTKANNYLMSSPTIYDMHVNSVYVRIANTYSAEFGWLWDPTNGPRWFQQRIINGIAMPTGKTGNPTPGTNHELKVGNINGSNDFVFAVDGTTLWQLSMGGFHYGDPSTSSERNDRRESNYGHFWSIQKKVAPSGNWTNWGNLSTYIDSDPDYSLHKANNTECSMQNP